MPKQKTVTDHRMQIYLPDDLYQRAKRKAEAEKISLAAVIRLVLENELPQQKTVPKSLLESLQGLQGIEKNGPTDMSKNLNKYLKKMYEAN